MISNAAASSPLLDDPGLHFVVGLSGSSLTEREADLLNKLRPAGIILFKYNLDSAASDWPEKLRALIRSAKAASGRKSFLVSIDHEGGRVHRLREPVTHFPPAFNWREEAHAVGRAFALELRELEINLCFAPVADVRLEPQNKVIADRALSDDPHEAARRAVAFLEGLQSHGVLGCGKHFPGHGATVADSHLELPVVHASLETLRARELIPFKALLQSGLQLMMTAHVLYPEIDPDLPATVSPTIISGLLRSELNFNGAVITDALEMGALAGLTPRTKALGCINAGVDLLLVAQPASGDPVGDAFELAQGLEEGVKNGMVSSETLIRSRERIGSLFGFLQAIEQSAGREGGFLGCAEHQALATRCA